jgi:glycosyltransferase involved in cell wall biosynthesis
MKFLFVVHRAAPYNGGSEVYVQAMAEECKLRGHEVAILAGEQKGDYNGIRITNDAKILLLPWTLIIVHGFGPAVQNFVLQVVNDLPSPVLYMLILPSEHPASIKAMNECYALGWSTSDDFRHINNYNMIDKAVKVRHGIKYYNSIGKPGFKAKHNITSKMFLSAGGYWHNKKMIELADVFVKANIPAVLVTTGYDNRSNLMPEAIPDKIIPLLIDDKEEVLSAIAEADCYIMHSSQEGFGLVLLESMLNKTPWISRHIAGAVMLKEYGKTYVYDDELIHLLQHFSRHDFDLEAAELYVINNHLIKNTIDDIVAVAEDSINKRSKTKV